MGEKRQLIKNLHQCRWHFALLWWETVGLKMNDREAQHNFFSDVSNYYSSPVLAQRPLFELHVNKFSANLLQPLFLRCTHSLFSALKQIALLEVNWFFFRSSETTLQKIYVCKLAAALQTRRLAQAKVSLLLIAFFKSRQSHKMFTHPNVLHLLRFCPILSTLGQRGESCTQPSNMKTCREARCPVHH